MLAVFEEVLVCKGARKTCFISQDVFSIFNSFQKNIGVCGYDSIELKEGSFLYHIWQGIQGFIEIMSVQGDLLPEVIEEETVGAVNSVHGPNVVVFYCVLDLELLRVTVDFSLLLLKDSLELVRSCDEVL